MVLPMLMASVKVWNNIVKYMGRSVHQLISLDFIISAQNNASQTL